MCEKCKNNRLCKLCYNRDYYKRKKLINPGYFKKADRKKYLKKYPDAALDRAYPKSKEHKKLVRRNISNKYRTKKLSAQPKWVNTQEIKKIYMSCPEGYQVDHIIPLQGKTVSGLHVPWNLQYLTIEDNIKKSNKLILP